MRQKERERDRKGRLTHERVLRSSGHGLDFEYVYKWVPPWRRGKRPNGSVSA